MRPQIPKNKHIFLYSIVFLSVVGVHESLPKECTKILRNIHNAVLSFAEKEQLALDRVALVKLQPHAQVYRHYDAEPWYQDRKRFHLVLQSGEQDILSAGDETATVHSGEIWFIENKVLHRAHNKSSVPRLHVIFDGYPLQN